MVNTTQADHVRLVQRLSFVHDESGVAPARPSAMNRAKQYFSLFVALLLASSAVAFHMAYAWPKELAELSKPERDLLTLEPALESCLVFFVVLRRTASSLAVRLGALAPGQELIVDTHGNIRLTEILASVIVILFRGVFRIHPGTAASTDALLVAFSVLSLVVNVYEGVKHPSTTDTTHPET